MLFFFFHIRGTAAVFHDLRYARQKKRISRMLSHDNEVEFYDHSCERVGINVGTLTKSQITY